MNSHSSRIMRERENRSTWNRSPETLISDAGHRAMPQKFISSGNVHQGEAQHLRPMCSYKPSQELETADQAIKRIVESLKSDAWKFEQKEEEENVQKAGSHHKISPMSIRQNIAQKFGSMNVGNSGVLFEGSFAQSSRDSGMVQQSAYSGQAWAMSSNEYIGQSRQVQQLRWMGTQEGSNLVLQCGQAAEMSRCSAMGRQERAQSLEEFNYYPEHVADSRIYQQTSQRRAQSAFSMRDEYQYYGREAVYTPPYAVPAFPRGNQKQRRITIGNRNFGKKAEPKKKPQPDDNPETAKRVQDILNAIDKPKMYAEVEEQKERKSMTKHQRRKEAEKKKKEQLLA